MSLTSSLEQICLSGFLLLVMLTKRVGIHQLEKKMNITIHVNETAIEKLANYAVSSELGCRAITSVLTQCLDESLFDNPDCKRYNLSNAVMKFPSNR